MVLNFSSYINSNIANIFNGIDRNIILATGKSTSYTATTDCFIVALGYAFSQNKDISFTLDGEMISHDYASTTTLYSSIRILLKAG